MMKIDERSPPRTVCNVYLAHGSSDCATGEWSPGVPCSELDIRPSSLTCIVAAGRRIKQGGAGERWPGPDPNGQFRAKPVQAGTLTWIVTGVVSYGHGTRQ